MAYLIVETGGGQKRVAIAGSVTLGRQSGCTVPLDDSKLSREHTRVYYDGRCYRVEDQNSRNGTYLNGQRVSEPKMLKPGDQIKIGDTLILFQLDAQDQNLPPDARGEVALRPGSSPRNPAQQRIMDTQQRGALASRVQAVKDSDSGPGPIGRAFLSLVLLVFFAAGVYGSKVLFVWAIQRVIPK